MDDEELYSIALTLYRRLKATYDLHGVLWSKTERKETEDLLTKCAKALEIDTNKKEFIE